MPAVSFDSKSFLLQTGRASERFPLVGAAFDATLISPDAWGENLAQLRHAGFNTVVVRVPWSLHEPIPGRFDFSGPLDVRRVVELAGAEGLKVVLRIGPCVGGSFAGGGLPGWIAAKAGERLREASPAFLERVTPYWRALVGQWGDLQATRNGSGVPRPVIAVGIEDAWFCQDHTVGEAYFSILVRYAREVGIEVPLISANNCWYMQDGVIDAWQAPAPDPHVVMEELRAVQPDAPAVSLVPLEPHADRLAVDLAYRVGARSDFVAEVVAIRHAAATSAFGDAERAALDLRPLRRTLVFASTFGRFLADMRYAGERMAGGSRSAVSGCLMHGERGERIGMLHRVGAAVPSHRRANGEDIKVVAGAAAGIDFHASDLELPGGRLEWCTGSLVALSGDLLVVAGAPRGKVNLRVDGSVATITVPTEGGTPRVTRVRGMRVVAVPFGIADGVGIVPDGFEFVDRSGSVVLAVSNDGRIARSRSAAGAAKPPRALRLTDALCLVEQGLLDGTYDRFAPIAVPQSLGSYGVASAHGYYRFRFRQSGKKRRALMLPMQRFVDGGLVVDGARVTGKAPRKQGLRTTQAPVEVAKAGMHTIVAEVRNIGLDALGREAGAAVGVFGPVVDTVASKGVKCSEVPAARIDPTVVGRFVAGYSEGDPGAGTTVRWVFSPRKSDVVVRIPPEVALEFARGGMWFRLNGEIVTLPTAAGQASHLVLPAAKLAPMRPKRLAKGEKPPKAKAVKLEPADNELVVEPAVRSASLRRALRTLAFHEVRGEVAGAWAFARIEPPASWARAKPAPNRATGAPTFFRTTCAVDSPRELRLDAAHRGVATVWFNGQPVLVFDGAAPQRSAVIPRALVRAGVNEIVAFDPDGRMPEIALR